MLLAQEVLDELERLRHLVGVVALLERLVLRLRNKVSGAHVADLGLEEVPDRKAYLVGQDQASALLIQRRFNL